MLRISMDYCLMLTKVAISASKHVHRSVCSSLHSFALAGSHKPSAVQTVSISEGTNIIKP